MRQPKPQRFGDTGDDGEFTNGTHLPLFVNMTCLNGYFEAPNADSLAESLLNAKGGGAVAVWASSGLTEPEGQAAINQELIRLLFDGESLTLGEAAMRAKAATMTPMSARPGSFWGPNHQTKVLRTEQRGLS